MKYIFASALAMTMILGCTATQQDGMMNDRFASKPAVADHLTATDKNPLLGQEWIIEDITGSGVIDNSQPSLQFFVDGRLAVSATCNRILGSYKSKGTQLTIEPAGTTMMACPEALMDQEYKLLKLLPTVESYCINATGALVLTAADGTTIIARRQTTVP